MKDIFCPNCGTDISINDYESYTTCPCCGKLLTDSDDSDFGSDVVWFCDECGACLNKQSGFDEDYSSWICRECGHENSLSEDEIYESEADYQKDKEFKEKHWFLNAVLSGISEGLSSESSDEEDDEESNDVETSRVHISENSNHIYDKPQKSFLESIQSFFKVLLALVVIVVIGSIAFLVDAYLNGIPLDIPVSELQHTEYDSLESELEEAGFLFVDSYRLDDLAYDELYLENMVDTIEIKSLPLFSAERGYSRFYPIAIYYHSPGYALTPVSSKDAKGLDYGDAVDLFEKAGFGNIEIVHDYSLLLDPFHRYGTVEKITIEGKKSIDEGERFRVNVPIEITIYDKRKNNPENDD